ADADTPSVNKVDFNAQGVATVVLSGPSLTRLQDLAENSLQQQFNALPGVGTTSIRSGIVHEVHVTVDQDALRARGLSINNVVNVNRQEGISLVDVRLADANRIAVVDAVKSKIEELNSQLPANTHLDLVIDASTYTDRSFLTVRDALFEAVLATGLILLLFL